MVEELDVQHELHSLQARVTNLEAMLQRGSLQALTGLDQQKISDDRWRALEGVLYASKQLVRYKRQIGGGTKSRDIDQGVAFLEAAIHNAENTP